MRGVIDINERCYRHKEIEIKTDQVCSFDYSDDFHN